MSDKVIGAQVKIDTGNSNAEVKELNKNLDTLKGSMKDTGTATAATGKEIKEGTGSFSKLKDQMNTLPGPLKAAGEGVKGLGAAFKALLANPIVLLIAAIVAGLTLLYKAFTSTDAGAEKLEQVFSGIGAAIDVVRDRVLKVAGAISKFFSGDWAGAIKDGKQAVSGIGEEIATEFAAAAKATATLQALDDELRNLSVSRARLNADLAEAKEKINDADLSTQERRANVAKVREAEAKQNAAEIAEAEKRFKSLQDKYNQSDISDEQRDELAAQEIKVQQLKQQSSAQNRALNNLDRKLDKEDFAAQKEAAAAKKQLQEKSAADRKATAEKLFAFTSTLTKLQQDNELAQIKDGYDRQLKALDLKLLNEKAANQKAFDDGKITKEQQEKLNEALAIQIALQRSAVTDTHNKEIEAKEVSFQKDLAGIRQKTMLAGIKDDRQLEKVQLEISHQERLQQAIVAYADDQAKFIEAKAAIDEQFKQAQAKIDEKNAKEDAKKAFDKTIGASEAIINDPEASVQAKRDALALEVQANEEAYAAMTITEDTYTANKKKNSATAQALDKADLAVKLDYADKIASALGGLATLVGKQTAAGKALAVAEATISTIKGAVSSYTSLSSIPIIGPALGFVASGLAVAAGIANVKKILAVKVPGGGGDGGSVPSVSIPSAPIAPTQQGTSIDMASIKGIGDATSGRTYVLSSDIANDADRNARLNRQARLGS